MTCQLNVSIAGVRRSRRRAVPCSPGSVGVDDECDRNYDQAPDDEQRSAAKSEDSKNATLPSRELLLRLLAEVSVMGSGEVSAARTERRPCHVEASKDHDHTHACNDPTASSDLSWRQGAFRRELIG